MELFRYTDMDDMWRPSDMLSLIHLCGAVERDDSLEFVVDGKPKCVCVQGFPLFGADVDIVSAKGQSRITF